MTEQEFIGAVDGHDIDYRSDGSMFAVQADTNISAIYKDGKSTILYDGDIWKVTSNSELLEQFFMDIDIWHEVKPLKSRMVVYKATDKTGVMVPGFTTPDLEYAKSWLNSDFGGKNLVYMEVGPANSVTSEASLLSVADGYVVIPPGSPNIIDIGSDEIIVLTPTKTYTM